MATQLQPSNVNANEVDLSKVDFIVLVDNSASMNEQVGGDSGSNKSRWEWMQETVEGFARECSKHDDDGIGVGFFNSSLDYANNIGHERVREIFSKQSPKGGTDTGAAVKQILTQYRQDWDSKKTTKNLGLYVFTDGGANDYPVLESAIIEHTAWMKSGGHPDERTGILFAQVGYDPSATQLLNDLDNNLTSKGAAYDIVSTCTMKKYDNRDYTSILKSAFCE